MPIGPWREGLHARLLASHGPNLPRHLESHGFSAIEIDAILKYSSRRPLLLGDSRLLRLALDAGVVFPEIVQLGLLSPHAELRRLARGLLRTIPPEKGAEILSRIPLRCEITDALHLSRLISDRRQSLHRLCAATVVGGPADHSTAIEMTGGTSPALTALYLLYSLGDYESAALALFKLHSDYLDRVRANKSQRGEARQDAERVNDFHLGYLAWMRQVYGVHEVERWLDEDIEIAGHWVPLSPLMANGWRLFPAVDPHQALQRLSSGMEGHAHQARTDPRHSWAGWAAAKAARVAKGPRIASGRPPASNPIERALWALFPEPKPAPKPAVKPVFGLKDEGQ
jgi:hypothetical protein